MSSDGRNFSKTLDQIQEVEAESKEKKELELSNKNDDMFED